MAALSTRPLPLCLSLERRIHELLLENPHCKHPTLDEDLGYTAAVQVWIAAVQVCTAPPTPPSDWLPARLALYATLPHDYLCHRLERHTASPDEVRWLTRECGVRLTGEDVRQCLEEEMDVGLLDALLETHPPDQLLYDGGQEKECPILEFACQENCVPAVACLLKHGATPNLKYIMCDAMWIARQSVSVNPEILTLLCNHGAVQRFPDSAKHLMRCMVRRKTPRPLVQLMMDHGVHADMDLLRDAVNFNDVALARYIMKCNPLKLMGQIISIMAFCADDGENRVALFELYLDQSTFSFDAVSQCIAILVSQGRSHLLDALYRRYSLAQRINLLRLTSSAFCTAPLMYLLNIELHRAYDQLVRSHLPPSMPRDLADLVLGYCDARR